MEFLRETKRKPNWLLEKEALQKRKARNPKELALKLAALAKIPKRQHPILTRELEKLPEEHANKIAKTFQEKKQQNFLSKTRSLLKNKKIALALAGTMTLSLLQTACTPKKTTPTKKPPITTPKKQEKPLKKPEPPTFTEKYSNQYEAISPVLSKHHETLANIPMSEKSDVRFIHTMMFVYINAESIHNEDKLNLAKNIVSAYENAKRPLTSVEQFNHDKIKAMVETIEAAKKVLTKEHIKEISQKMESLNYNRQSYERDYSLDRSIKIHFKTFL